MDPSQSKPAPSGGLSVHHDSSAQLLHDVEVDSSPPQVGYRLSVWRCALLYPLAVLPFFLGLLLAYWFPHVWIRLTGYRCHLHRATYVIVKDLDGKYRVETVRTAVADDRYCLSSDHGKSSLQGGESEKVTFLVEEDRTVRYFEHRHLRYLYQPSEDRFVLLQGLDAGHTPSALHQMRGGLLLDEHATRLAHYGANSIDVPVKPYHILLVEEVLHPFYIFQLLAVAFWMADDYYYYSCAVFFISTVSLLVSLIQTRRHLQQLHDMVAGSCTVTVIRDGREVEGVPSESVVPGDVLVVPPSGMAMPCDAVLLTGQAIVNEAMLTGESVPVTKTPLPHHPSHYYHPDRFKRHTLFNGTQVIQTRFYGNKSVLALAVRTGFSTSKGGMVRSILFPRKLSIKFYADAMKFVLLLGVLASFGLVYTLAIELTMHYEVKETVLRALDVITIVVPPALPAALTVGTIYALNRLRKKKIYCISPQRVTLCGKVKLVCFDKTGTLTEDSLDLLGVQPVFGGCFTSELCSARDLPSCPLLFAMATCHSLATIEGQLSGDPIDLKMFLGTGWTLEEPPPGSFDSLVPTVARPPPSESQAVELAQLRQFTFSSELQRMSVMVRAEPSADPRLLHLYCKGAPETIRRLCRPETIPADFFQVLGVLTQRGYRVLGVAHRTLHMAWHKAERVQREAVECDLTFAGLVVMQNRLKPETTPVISTLCKANIRTVMITGDNLLTAVSVARECGMVPSTHRVIVAKASPSLPLTYHQLEEGEPNTNLVASVDSSGYQSNGYQSNGGAWDDHDERSTTPLLQYQREVSVDMEPPFQLAIDGKSFAVMKESYKEEFQKLLVKGTVFARMSPDQKAQLVTALQDIGYGVAMCGDGANDCGALKTAHAGISLSETEASVASPFTSKIPNISCVPIVIKEGRCALVTSFSIFKFMALYSLTEFISAAILYAYESNLGDWQYLYIDLILIFAFSVVMGYTGPYPHLVRRRPLGTLAGVHVFLSLCVQTVLLVAFQVGALYYLKYQPWYKPLQPSPTSDNIVCSENTVVFQTSIFQYVALAVALSTAAPYRRPLFTNLWFLLALLILLPMNLYLTLAPDSWWPWMWSVIQVKPHPSLIFCLTLVELALLNFIIAYFLEGYIFPSDWMRQILRWVRCKKKPRNRYKHLLSSLPPHWPPVQEQLYTST